MAVFLLSDAPTFPPPYLAQRNGLLAVGGDLAERRLITAYRNGIFPWYGEGEPILWWSPDPRLVLFPEKIHVSRRLKRVIRSRKFHLSMDTAFREVITACAQVRLGQGEGTWIDPSMIEAYCRLHALGFAHSVEVRCDGRLCGGLYGVAMGGCFFGESMFSNVRDASKVALAFLAGQLRRWSFLMIDCQTVTPHLIRMGAEPLPRPLFLEFLEKAMRGTPPAGPWFPDTDAVFQWILARVPVVSGPSRENPTGKRH